MACPNNEKLELYMQGQLDDTESSELDTHLENCKKCSSRLDDIRKNQSFLLELKSFYTPEEKTDLKVSEKSFTKEQAQALLPKQYHVIRKIDQGGDGHVFHATDDNMGRLVAIKFLLGDEKISEGHWREARLMGNLNHPNIATIYAAEEKDGIRFIIMEWVEGVQLTDKCRGMSLKQKMDIYLRVLNAIAEAHTRGIVHRDIKPSNILVDSLLRPKVLDFGISVESHIPDFVSRNIYRGSPPFSAPEQITRRHKITPATDVFALCILLYELLTEQLPFSQKNIKELFDAITKKPPKSPRAINSKVPETLEKICLKGLVSSVNYNFPSMTVFSTLSS